MSTTETVTNGLSDQDVLYRAVNCTPSLWFEKDGVSRPASSIFKDPKGVSVDIEDGRTEEEVIQSFKHRPGWGNLKAVLKFSVSDCQGLHVVRDSVEGNPHHALICKSDSDCKLTKGQIRKLLKAPSLKKIMLEEC